MPLPCLRNSRFCAQLMIIHRVIVRWCDGERGRRYQSIALAAFRQSQTHSVCLTLGLIGHTRGVQYFHCGPLNRYSKWSRGVTAPALLMSECTLLNCFLTCSLQCPNRLVPRFNCLLKDDFTLSLQSFSPFWAWRGMADSNSSCSLMV